jgi:DNA-binding Lrp family transcriptional regulator
VRILEASLAQKLDNIDFQILRIFQEDSRTSYRKIADTLEIAIGTVYNRIKKLDKEIIKAYTVMVDPTKLGYDLTTLTLIQAKGSHLEEVEKKIAQSNHAMCVYDITGDFDIAIIARFKNKSMLNTFIKEILKNPHVTRTVTNVTLNVVKEDFGIKI